MTNPSISRPGLPRLLRPTYLLVQRDSTDCLSRLLHKVRLVGIETVEAIIAIGICHKITANLRVIGPRLKHAVTIVQEQANGHTLQTFARRRHHIAVAVLVHRSKNGGRNAGRIKQASRLKLFESRRQPLGTHR